MPATYSFKEDLVWLRLEGTYTTDDLRQTVTDALADPELPAAPKFLMDVTQSGSLTKRSANDVKSMAAFFAANAGALGDRLAILAVKGGLSYGLMRMASVHAEFHDLETEVFDDREAAITWLYQRCKHPGVIEPTST